MQYVTLRWGKKESVRVQAPLPGGLGEDVRAARINAELFRRA